MSLAAGTRCIYWHRRVRWTARCLFFFFTWLKPSLLLSSLLLWNSAASCVRMGCGGVGGGVEGTFPSLSVNTCICTCKRLSVSTVRCWPKAPLTCTSDDTQASWVGRSRFFCSTAPSHYNIVVAHLASVCLFHTGHKSAVRRRPY